MKKIAVIGAGSTGWSVAAELSMRGYEVWLCDIFGKEEYSHYEVAVSLGGSITGNTVIRAVTTDAEAALKGAGQVICCTISNADEQVAEYIAPFLEPGSAVLLSAGNLGAFVYRRTFERCGRRDVTVGETSGNLFSCRRTGEAEVFFGGAYDVKNVAAFPARDTAGLIEAFRGIYELRAVDCILEAAFNGPNLLSHISLIVVNAGAIESCQGTYYSFKQAICPSTIAIADRLWEEKKAVMDALRFPCGPSPSANFRKYADPSIYTFDNFKALSGPNSMQERHISEDVPIIGCLFLSVAEALGVKVPLYRALVTVASAINQTDYYRKGRTLERLGLGGLKGKQIAEYFMTAE